MMLLYQLHAIMEYHGMTENRIQSDHDMAVFQVPIFAHRRFSALKHFVFSEPNEKFGTEYSTLCFQNRVDWIVFVIRVWVAMNPIVP